MNKQILRLAIPNILSNLSVPLLSSVDTAVMGHLDSPIYLGAIAVGSMIFSLLYWSFGFLRMGTTGLTAQAYGSKNSKEISNILFRAFFISIGIGIAFIILQKPISEIVFYFVDGSNEVEMFAGNYFDIRIYAAPATLALFVFNGWFLGMQNAKIPLVLSLFVNFLNIGFNLLFVYQFDMKVEGIALGTVLSQYLGLILSIVLLKKYYSNKINYFRIKQIFNSEKLLKFFKLNLDIFLRTLLLISTIAFFTAKSAEFNDNILAANFILLQLWLIVSYGVDGFAFASESLVGKFIGARDSINLKKVISHSFAWGIGLGLLTSAIYLVFGREIIGLYTNQKDVIDVAMNFIIWVTISPVINSISFIWDGIYIGATETRKMFYSMLISVLIFFYPIFFLTLEQIGNHSIWLALTFFMVIRGLTLTIYSKRIFNKFSTL
ncbi:MAG: MATE family efflux transporter [Ignavibacteriae bacterium]|nr:MATE family efflux transporter [Ignavibacteriota bacterium]